MYKAIIADDEPLASQYVAGLLQASHPDITIAAIVGNGYDAFRQFKSTSPTCCY